MRQLRDAEPKPRYADYERVAQQLEVDRPHWSAETQEEWRVFRRAANEEADDWKRARMSDRIVASPTPGERPESPPRTPPFRPRSCTTQRCAARAWCRGRRGRSTA